MNKTGRNDPCPCGSGKKYKQCCANQKSIAKSPNDVKQQLAHALQSAHQFEQAGHVAQAEALCHNILQRLPNQPDAHHLLGVIALRDGNIELAVKYLNQATRLNSKNAQFFANLGLAYHEQGALDLAVLNYRKATALNPAHIDAHYNLHAALLNEQALAPAITCLEQAITLNPQDAEALFMQGLLLAYDNQHEASQRYFNRLKPYSALMQARLDAWQYLQKANATLPPMLGSIYQTLEWAMKAAQLEGLVLEFGVRHGNSIRQLARLAQQAVHGFDSFEGLPESWHHENKGSYSTKGHIPKVPKNVTLHTGWFNETLPKFLAAHHERARLINIDCDIYSSTKTVLDLLSPRIGIGTVIVFDEYIGIASVLA